MRKLALPALAACALFAASAPAASAAPAKASATIGSKLSKVSGALKAAQKALSQMKDINDGQTGAINGVDGRVDTVVANLAALDAKVTAIVKVATESLTKLQDGVLALKSGLESLAAAVQGPGVAGQLGAAGTAAPGAGNAATPSTLPTGTVYRQIVIATTGPLAPTGPIGARTWVKMPDVPALGYSNTYVCTSAGTTAAASGAGYTLTCSGGT